MKKVIYIYVLDTLADWEIGYILQVISMQSMLKEPNIGSASTWRQHMEGRCTKANFRDSCKKFL